jgi:signal transduction histidine kinase
MLLFLLLVVTLLLLLVVAANAVASRRAGRALQETAQHLEQRTALALRPLALDHPPAELAPLIRAINALLARAAKEIVAERQYSASAAHELRTPLAAIKIHAQVALRAKNEMDRRLALERVTAGIDQATHMIEQLLELSRVDGLAAMKARATRIRLDAVATRVMADLRPIAQRRRQVFASFVEPAEIDGMESGVAAMLRNLIDNAMRYGPESGTVRVSTGTDAGGAGILRVEDAGPGIDKEDHQRVFERFRRLSADTDGCGIGLSIVRTVVELHAADIELDRSDLGGLRVTVRFPPTPGPKSAPIPEVNTGYLVRG